MSVTNLYVYDQSKIDVSKVRIQATEVAAGTYRGRPAEVALIHYHDYEDTCENKKHERYTPNKEDVGSPLVEHLVSQHSLLVA